MWLICTIYVYTNFLLVCKTKALQSQHESLSRVIISVFGVCTVIIQTLTVS